MLRLDYTPQDTIRFQQAIEQVAVPAATRIYEKHRRRLGVASLRPWDLDQDLYPIQFPVLPSYGSVENLKQTAQVIFRQVDPQLGEYFRLMQEENLLDLENRKGKAPGGYCTSFPVSRQPFIFMNAAGLSSDVRTILHEAGHAFHNYERFELPYAQQRIPGLEFAEVASMAMELLASPYLSINQGGFYPTEAAARARSAHLEHILLFWPYMAVVDAFQHWAYENHAQASQASYCDARWLELWQRFLPGVDWSGLEAEAETGWHRKQHIHRYPFYHVEYGVAQLGAVLVWRNALQDQAEAVVQYRYALSLGGTATLPDLFRAAGARFAFDAETLSEAVDLVEHKIYELETELRP
jgi:oligoendopeptidase F